MNVEPIGWVHCGRVEPQEDGWDSVPATISLDSSVYGPEALHGLDEFSHVEIVYVFDQVDPNAITTLTHHPRGNPKWPAAGVFAQRNPARPNRIGTTVCRLESVEGMSLAVIGLDALDGTPVLDIKPYVTEFGARGPVRQPPYTRELLANYWRVG